MTKIKKYLLMTDDVYKVIIKLYPTLSLEIFDAIDALGGVVMPVDGGGTINNGFVIAKYENYSIEVDGNIVVQDGTKQFMCNNIILIGDISDYLDYAKKKFDLQKQSIVKYFFINLMRYSERVRDDVFNKKGINNGNNKSVILRINGHYYFDVKSLEAYLNKK